MYFTMLIQIKKRHQINFKHDFLFIFKINWGVVKKAIINSTSAVHSEQHILLGQSGQSMLDRQKASNVQQPFSANFLIFTSLKIHLFLVKIAKFQSYYERKTANMIKIIRASHIIPDWDHFLEVDFGGLQDPQVLTQLTSPSFILPQTLKLFEIPRGF